MDTERVEFEAVDREAFEEVEIAGGLSWEWE